MTRQGTTHSRSALAALLAACIAGTQAHTAELGLDASLGQPVVLAGQKQVAYLRIAMTGFALDRGARAPVNVALVLDKSGSMAGEKLDRLKIAAAMAVDQLHAGDFVSIVAYDDTVQVLTPAMPVIGRAAIHAAIQGMTAGGQSSLFGGISKGAAELRKHFDPHRVNRIILLSDGRANIGPHSPRALRELGSSLMADGISVTTIGLGLEYSEDLMSELAQSSDGHHFFVEDPTALETAFASEFGSLLSVVAQDVRVKIRCENGVRPLRVLGREASIMRNDVSADLNQICAGQTKYVLLEVEMEPGEARSERGVAKIEVTYENMDSQVRDTLGAAVTVHFTEALEEVRENVNESVMVAMVREMGVLNTLAAMRLRDAGKLEEARDAFMANDIYLRGNLRIYPSELLEQDVGGNFSNVTNLDESSWPKQRKEINQATAIISLQQVQITRVDLDENGQKIAPAESGTTDPSSK